MISFMKPSRFVKKLQKMATTSHKKLPVAQKGHFVVYTIDQKRFEIPLLHLNNNIFLELLRVSEEEFGLSSDGPITFPCDAIFMDKIVSLVQHGEAKGLDKALINSITASHCSFSASFHQLRAGQHSVCGY